MDRMLYIGMSGAKESFLALAQNNHNLSNIATTGFRAELAQFRSQPVFGPGMPTRAYAMDERPGMDLRAGPLINTGRDLDVAIKGDGWIAVQARDGEEAYTRAGDFQVTNLGMLVTGNGLPVIGNGGPIALPAAENVIIQPDGSIAIQPIGQGANALVVVDRIKLVKPNTDNLQKGEDGLIRTRDGQNAAPSTLVSVVSGALEGSNVTPADALVKMVQYQRHYELQVKSMATAKENDQSSQTLLKFS
ncbi:MAG: flagellar basal body rod protein FlgF [Gammaproteobacteria bacterium]|nr:flagellar basal body rod protein FlgF [Gammaproteobacteria bacterium]